MQKCRVGAHDPLIGAVMASNVLGFTTCVGSAATGACPGAKRRASAEGAQREPVVMRRMTALYSQRLCEGSAVWFSIGDPLVNSTYEPLLNICQAEMAHGYSRVVEQSEFRDLR